jgi:hypothetical protein
VAARNSGEKGRHSVTGAQGAATIDGHAAHGSIAHHEA